MVAEANGTVVQKTHYYPFGMAFAEKTAKDEGQKEQPYKYNGKELDRRLQLNTYDYEARYMDPAIGRFTTVDPLAEKYYSISPYAYCLNDPIKHTDPDGKAPWIGALVGAAIDYGFQVGINYAAGKSGAEAWTNIDMGSIAISAVAGATGVGLANVVSKGVAASKVIQHGNKVLKVGAVVVGDAAVGATVSTGTQLAKTGEVDAKTVVIDAATSAVTGQAASQVKTLKQNSQQGKNLQRRADHDARVAGTAEGRTPSRASRVEKANASAQKAEVYGDKSAAATSTAASNVMSKTINDDEKK